VGEGTFDVLDTDKRRNAADVLANEGEKHSTMLAAMVRASSLLTTACPSLPLPPVTATRAMSSSASSLC
jgi:hypothetical protein